MENVLIPCFSHTYPCHLQFSLSDKIRWTIILLYIWYQFDWKGVASPVLIRFSGLIHRNDDLEQYYSHNKKLLFEPYSKYFRNPNYIIMFRWVAIIKTTNMCIVRMYVYAVVPQTKITSLKIVQCSQFQCWDSYRLLTRSCRLILSK